MSTDSGPVVRYVDQQLAALKKYPLMWGPPLCVELAYLQLLETLVVALRPDLDQREPMLVKDRYRRFLALRFPSHPPGYLAFELGEPRITELVSALSEFEQAIRAEASPQNPFEHCDLALELVLDPGASLPSSKTLTSYLEVRLGGSLVSRYRPVSLLASAKRNLMTVVVENQVAEPFDGQGVIRALDLDQASFRLRTDDGTDHHCLFFMDPTSALQSWEFDARVRVRGERYSSLARKAVVFVDRLEILAAT